MIRYICIYILLPSECAPQPASMKRQYITNTNTLVEPVPTQRATGTQHDPDLSSGLLPPTSAFESMLQTQEVSSCVGGAAGAQRWKPGMCFHQNKTN